MKSGGTRVLTDSRFSLERHAPSLLDLWGLWELYMGRGLWATHYTHTHTRDGLIWLRGACLSGSRSSQASRSSPSHVVDQHGMVALPPKYTYVLSAWYGSSPSPTDMFTTVRWLRLGSHAYGREGGASDYGWSEWRGWLLYMLEAMCGSRRLMRPTCQNLRPKM